jgi:hypothetical protein
MKELVSRKMQIKKTSLRPKSKRKLSLLTCKDHSKLTMSEVTQTIEEETNDTEDIEDT